ncbi:N-acetyl-gamma-glutamyl-phosphate reductase [Actinoalloteichus sp. AHMU CJ021]|uniref:N-acetyl-gamma-glutamyl-phosphate reductase n=1 Tax=Actinoalloteichus caeruleus DSM 43889 TaxID=1120930 RepID=A0ABT1JDE3_ACTCY|nr:N-acetyl-gamma-glutamyl-phosphate reductase [Actinoalloteichus caeruleus]AUS80767.1 N-acetyl-gamma-glutamyl-phosphate reductase [Actinoalloteichus sp. AHMU CJ021]MCP2330166.1 N-acetyl-gamma-glutamyl-phosphate reductase [Actinoalloteichus caeruleus DSM 43889]
MTGRLRVGVVGATGWAGRELCRLLLGHPEVGEIVPAARDTTRSFAAVHPNLLGSGLEFVHLDALVERAGALDVVFLCVPAGEAMGMAPELLRRGTRVVDLSADFRFPDPALYERIYARPHSSPELLPEAVFGVTELVRDRLPEARLVANPGCYVISVLLGLLPLAEEGLLGSAGSVHVHAVNGTTGASAKPTRDLHHAEVFGSMLPYSLEGHRHSGELELHLGRLAGGPVDVVMSTAHGAFARGILAQITVLVPPEHRDGLSREALTARYLGRYGSDHSGEHFVLVNDLEKRGGANAKEYGAYPRLSNVVGTNYCHLGVDHDPARSVIKVVSVIDNLGKGAAGSAVQNMNVMVGLPDTTGLRAYAP